MMEIIGFLQLALCCLVAALFVHLMFCVSMKRRFFSRYNLVVVFLCALYVAAIVEATWVVGNGWILVAGFVAPLAYAFLKALLETSR